LYANFNILHVKLENAYSRSQNRRFGDFTPKMGSSMNEIQKAHPWAETRRMTNRSSKSVYVCGLGASQRRCFFTCSPRPPTLSQRHMDLHVWAYPRLGYTSQVSSKSVHGFRSPRGSNLAFPITLAIGFYNSLYYRTSPDYS